MARGLLMAAVMATSKHTEPPPETFVPNRRKYHPADFSNRQWRHLLAFALERADAFECAVPYPVVRQDLESAPLWPMALEAFRHDLADRHVSLIRWELVHDYPTQFVRFQMSPRLAEYIRGVRRLTDWAWESERPEDPTLLRRGEVLLATESVDGRIAVYADSQEVDLLSASGVRLIEPLGVKAEPWPTP